MFELSRSSSGQYVVIHRPTQTCVVGDDLQAAFDRARAEVGDGAEVPAATAAAPGGASGRARLLGIGLLALLPFVWLGAMHVSLGRLVTELRVAPQAPAPQLEDLRARIDRLEQQVDHLDRARPAASPASKSEPTKADPAKAEPAEAEPVETEPAKAVPSGGAAPTQKKAE